MMIFSDNLDTDLTRGIDPWHPESLLAGMTKFIVIPKNPDCLWIIYHLMAMVFINRNNEAHAGDRTVCIILF